MQKTLFQSVLIIGFLFGIGQVQAQDVILLQNGAEVKGKITADQGAMYTVDVINDRGKTKSLEIEKYRIFSVVKEGQDELVLYKQDSLLGNFYSVEEMRYFIYGQQDAQKAYSHRGAFIAGFVLGLGTVALTSGGFQDDPGLVPLVTPFVCVIYYGSRKVKIRMEYVSDPEYLSHETYINGYVRIARKKRVFGALKGSVGGISAGIVTWLLVSGSNDSE